MTTVREVFETNTFGVMAMTQAVLPQFRARKSGVIVNVTSSATLAPMPLVAVYTASKMAIEGFTESLALELEAFHVRVKLVEPGYCGRMKKDSTVLRVPLASRGRWLCLVPCLLMLACVTMAPNARSPSLEERCNGGSASACESWGHQLKEEHQEEAADGAFGQACARGSISACVIQGKARMERGDLEGAEPPLRRAYDADWEDGALALADLYEARGDGASASRLRWEALAIDKSTVEVAVGLRIPWRGGLGGSLDVNVQPMGLEARRLILGANLSLPDRPTLNATVGYQYFVTSWAAPYARALVGSHLGERRARLNLGTEVGVKLFGGPMGHLGAAVGGANDGSVYTVVELGMDWVVALTVLAHL